MKWVSCCFVASCGFLACSGSTTPSNPETTARGDTVSCDFVQKSELSSAIPTVGMVNWQSDLPDMLGGKIEFQVADGSGPVFVTDTISPASAGHSLRTLLLGMKAQCEYTYRLIAYSEKATCRSDDYSITTGSLAAELPSVDQDILQSGQQTDGYIVTSLFAGGDKSFAVILDAVGDIVWWAKAPASTSRAHLSYDGTRMWMMSINANNKGGSMAWVSLDGLNGETDLTGFASAHHDFCVLPDNGMATLLWNSTASNAPSDLVERAEDGTFSTVLTLDEKTYPASAFHANSLHYQPWSDSYTVGDRSSSLFLKLARSGDLLWQLGGICANTQAPACSPATWKTNHGHDLLENGHFLFFSNGTPGSNATVLGYALMESATPWTATSLSAYAGDLASETLGDTQWLPGGHALITYSNAGFIHELSAEGELIRTLRTDALGYADWRPRLYGPPSRY